MNRIPAERLRALRNDLDILLVIRDLKIPNRPRDARRLSFRCPYCLTFHTALSRTANVGRCFRCGRTLNPIDLAMGERDLSFLDAVQYLEGLLSDRRRP